MKLINCEKLNWDSNFFGINIGKFVTSSFSLENENIINNFAKESNLEILEYHLDYSNNETQENMDKLGYSLKDIKYIFKRTLDESIDNLWIPEFVIRKIKIDEIENFQNMTLGMFNQSRYYKEPKFELSKVDLFYKTWMANAIKGIFDDFAIGIFSKNIGFGFCSIKILENSKAKIGLFGIDQNHSGKGLGRILLYSTINYLRDLGIKYCQVATQSTNLNAQKLYSKCGFVMDSTSYIYHKTRFN